MVEPFTVASRITYDDTGLFNEDDLMRIYRQYGNEQREWEDESYRSYLRNFRYATGTSISLGSDWRVAPGRTKMDPSTDPAVTSPVIKVQTKADSMTWENGKVVRFRSWTRSNYAYCLTNCYRDKRTGITNYYPDFCVSDWVTLSGPTQHIPLSMRHACSRIVFDLRTQDIQTGVTGGSGNQFHKVEVATEWEDYKRIDNADTTDHDTAETESSKTDEEAQRECNEVLAAYNRMCMPAGVDINGGELYAMQQSYWEAIDDDAEGHQKIRFLEDEDTNLFYHYGKQNAEYIRTTVQRPIFANVNQRCYLLTIPYDMSNDANLQGEIITLPPCTRFRVYMRDVNHGDGHHTENYEGTYHIFSLQDIRDRSKSMVNDEYPPMFPDGLTMLPGYSYRFYVGYRYDRLTITANDHFSWVQQDAEKDPLESAAVAVPETSPAEYTWWKTTLKESVPKDGGDYNPIFHITSEKEFVEFINLVNGTAPLLKDDNLKRAKRNKENPEHADNQYDIYNWWYTSVSDNKRDTTWVTSAEATKMGYLLYESYHAANGNQPAFSQEEYVRGSFPFYDQSRDRHYTVYLDKDLDLADWLLPSIGENVETPFMGYFDGQMHSIRNARMAEEYLFKYIKSAAIRNLTLESTHKLSLLKEGSNTCYIVGIDLQAHSTQNPIAERLTSNQYNNPSYVVGCLHIGDAGGALVGASGNLYMYGCMHAAEGIPTNTGALLGEYLPYSETSNWQFFNPQISYDMSDMSAVLKGKPSWGRFMCNYYDTELSPNTNAVANIRDKYSPLEYIRGRDSFILKAKNDNLLEGDITFNTLTDTRQRLAFYGIAPWKAMNYAIHRYNLMSAGLTHKCDTHYENNSTGYVHRYPNLLPGEPTSVQFANPLEQEN